MRPFVCPISKLFRFWKVSATGSLSPFLFIRLPNGALSLSVSFPPTLSLASYFTSRTRQFFFLFEASLDGLLLLLYQLYDCPIAHRTLELEQIGRR